MYVAVRPSGHTSSTSRSTMKDITSYFTTPRKSEPVTTAITKSCSSKASQQPNGSCEKGCEKRKLESASEAEENIAKSKCKSPISPAVKSQLNANLAVMLTQIDVDVPKNVSPAKKADVRVFKNVLLKNISKPDEGINNVESETKSTKKRQKKRKRIRVAETDTSDDEKSDSSAKLFKENKKPIKPAAASINRRSDANNLFKYFSKAEKKPACVEDNDSPIKCHRIVKVEAMIHSPPKVRRNLSDDCESEAKFSKTNHPCIDDVRLPVVKIVRADSANSKALDEEYKALDEIIEIDTDFVDTSTFKKSNPKITSSTDEDESSDNFTPPKVLPWKMRVQFVSGTNLQRRRRKSESKDKKLQDASGNMAETKPTVETSTGVAEKGLTTEVRFEEAEKAVAQETVLDGAVKKVTVETVISSVKEIIPKTAEAAKEISSEAVTNGAEPSVTAKASDEAAEKKVPIRAAIDFVDKKFTISLKRVEQRTPTKVNVDAEVIASPKAAGFVEDKPVIKKLAPLFCRAPAQKKVPPKPENTEARRQFLQSGVPDNIKKQMEEQKKSEIEDSIYREYRFPEPNHVQQIEPTNWIWNLEEVTSFNEKRTDNEVLIPEFDSLVALVSHRKPVETGSRREKLNVAEEIAMLKKQEPDVNVGDVFASVKKLSKDVGRENGTLCWTEKYKPSTYSDFIGNSTNLLKLKEWIESHKRIRIKLSDSDGDSSDDFVGSDDSSCSMDTRNNVALLVGPPGCGKTCAVYTLANELGFKVLEVNAASNRNGKRILDELQEATQSHRVKRSSIFDKNVKKSKKKKKASTEEKKTMSLILIEDADTLFENYDDGFLTALSSLTLHSKRPFIFTVNNLNYPHLVKYTKNQTLVLTFAYPTVSLLNVWLRSIALNEGVRLSDEVLMYLFHVAGLDLRKSLLQLQMLISSNKYQSTLSNEQLFYTSWWKRITKKSKIRSTRHMTDKITTTPIKLFSDDDDEDEKSVPEKSEDLCEEAQVDLKNTSERIANVKALEQMANLYERIAMLGNFESTNSNQFVACPCEETMDQSSDSLHCSQLNDDIADSIKTHIFSESCNIDSSFSFREYYSKIRINKDIKQIVDNVFCNFIPKPSNKESKYCDYLPAVRDIARIESCKASGQRRSSRYFSYLNSVNIHVSEKETNFLSNSLL